MTGAPHELGQTATRPPDRVSFKAALVLGGMLTALLVAALLVFVPLPYVVMSPGPVTNTLGEIDGGKIITVKGEPTYPTSGALDFTTVRVSGGPGYRINVYDLASAWLSGQDEILREEEVYPKGATEQQVEEDNTAQMQGSQQVAAATALRALGKDVPVRVSVESVVAKGPSDGKLKAGDVLVSVDGTPAKDPAAVRAAVTAHKPGEPVTFVVSRGGKNVTETVTTSENSGRAIVGIAMGGRYDLPVDVEIHAGAVGGPSAGLMFTLGIYDVLTQGPLTAGQQIAGTGTMNDDGSVGPIGGIRQKLVGAKDGGAKWFLAPAENCAEVAGHAPAGLRVVKVGTFNDARTAVEAIAAGKASALPTCG